ncbi:MAG TPA: DNA/RNA helicase domain-containing protein [Candidatus Sulfotelmatobacter sp.]|nr:DNA/RNA helicase domain-containing protein [Candidatus Sulfotelmatobacter sp.]
MPGYYADTAGSFLAIPSDQLELRLTRAYESDRYKDLITAQFAAWRDQIRDLKDALQSTDLAKFNPDTWGIAMEFVVPRKMGRIDTVLLIGSSIVVLEFKGESVDSSAADQVEDYCLDLLHFHEGSHNKPIYPAVVGKTDRETRIRRSQAFGELHPTAFVDAKRLGAWLATVAQKHGSEPQPVVSSWNRGNYRPVPTIIEAAVGMFAEMQVDDIAKAGCDPINLTSTIDTIRGIVIESARSNRKTVCFVTGVPGAGKTLAGLQLVHDAELRQATQSDSIFLTGNLPLVEVLQAALARDASRRRKHRLRVSSRDPKTTINTVLGYKREHTRNKSAPHENIVVFDEAQRAWDAKRTAKYLDESSREFVDHSEPALMLAILDRQRWAVLIAFGRRRARD